MTTSTSSVCRAFSAAIRPAERTQTTKKAIDQKNNAGNSKASNDDARVVIAYSVVGTTIGTSTIMIMRIR